MEYNNQFSNASWFWIQIFYFQLSDDINMNFKVEIMKY